MKITSGLFDHMVLQRNARDLSDTPVCGETTARDGEIFLRADKKFRAWKRAARVRRGKFQFRLKGLPTGGPYAIELQLRHGRTVAETLMIRDVLVGDVWIVAGQSNMQGCGYLTGAAKPHPSVRAFYMGDRWGVAKDTIHDLWNCVDQAHMDFRGARPEVLKYVGTGPAVEFGKELRKRTGAPQGLIACSHGGTSMNVWSPALKKLKGKSFYGATLRRFHKNGGKVAGIIWYQGESDAMADMHLEYTRKMKDLVRGFRRDMGDAKLPFALVQIGRTINADTFDRRYWNSIQEQQRLLPHILPKLAVVPAIDSELDDSVHIGGESNHRLGRRLADAMHYLIAGRKAALPPIDLRGVDMKFDARYGHTNILVHFDNVQGSLRSEGRASGFAIADHAEWPALFSMQPMGNKVLLRSTLPPQILDGLMLHYGYGTNPYCNIHDEGDRSLPVFGPIPLLNTRVSTPFVRRLQATKLLPGAGDLRSLPYPKNLDALPWRNLEFNGQYCRLDEEFKKMKGKDRMVYYRFKVDVREKMNLDVLFGYDGKIKIWIDGREKFRDPKGGPPMLMDSKKIRWNATRGIHEIVIAFGSDTGEAWGICMRLQRNGISLQRAKKNPYAIPHFLNWEE